MKPFAVLFLTLSTLPACASTFAMLGGSAPDKRPMEIADFYRCAGVGAPAVSKTGGLVAFSVKRYDLEGGKTWSELWLMNWDGSNLRQMTAGKNNDTEPAFSPDGKTLLFASSRDGGGQLWTMPIDGGEPKKLTSWAPGLSSASWSPDGRWIAATSDVFPECGIDADCNAKNADGLEKGKLKVHVADDLYYRHWTGWADGKRSHILLIDAASGKVAKDLTPGDFESPTFSLGGRGFAFSPDSKELCYVSNHEQDEASTTNADLWTVPVDGEITATTAKNITSTNKGWDGAPLYSPDGRYIGFVTQATPGYESDLKALAFYERKSGGTFVLTTRSTFPYWIEDFRWMPDSSGMVLQAEHQGRNPLYRIERRGSTPVEVLRHGFIAGWELSFDGSEVVYAHRSISEPTEVFTAKLASPAPKRLTTYNEALANEVDFRPAEEHWFQGDGDYKVHCFLVKPHGFDPAKKYPLVLNVHGGPQSQWADAFRGDWQVYPAKGYVVAFCNPTGSTGYGQALTDGITGDWGGRVYRDLMKVTDELEKLPFVDKDRMGVMGWSYGGYMTMWMQGHTTRFKCIASMMGVYDLEAEYGATEEMWFPEHDFRGTPWDSADYQTWSASNFVKNFKTPALVITGELDYRVPYTQSLAYYTALRKRNVPARLVVFPNAGHWPAWNEMAFYYNAHLDFFHQYLGGDPAPYDVTKHARNLAFDKKDEKAAGKP
ncbi:MAG: S9 family peptidase [Planctomycetes bacterium]|nr:S9 family peptidase [Planctomycetota bacterium]